MKNKNTLFKRSGAGFDKNGFDAGNPEALAAVESLQLLPRGKKSLLLV